jgi:hypothetical protein
MAKRDWAGLVNIEVVAGLAEREGGEYRGFLTIRATASDGSFMSGQLDPAEVRKMALNFLGSAEAAVQDAIVMNLMTRVVELDPPRAANFIASMRDERARIDPDPDDR